MIGTKSVVVIALMAIALLVLTACGSRKQGQGNISRGVNAAAVEAPEEAVIAEVVQVAQEETHSTNEEEAEDHEGSEATCHHDDETSHGSETDAVECAHDDKDVDEHSDEVTEPHHEGDLDTGAHVENAVADGLQQFRALGCVACHGMDGEGILGPAMAGHTVEQIHNQVRMPVNSMQFKDANDNPILMPAFTEDMISDDQLGLIATWVESLGPATGENAHAHGEDMSMATALVEAGEAVSDASVESAAHLRLAFFAIHDGDIHDTGHHLADLIAGLEDGEAKVQAKLILTNLGSEADLHKMEDLVVAMVPNADTSFGARFHLQLTMDSLSLDDLDAAGYHLGHFIELTSGADKIMAQETQMLLAEGDMHEVDHVIEELMGMAPHADH